MSDDLERLDCTGGAWLPPAVIDAVVRRDAVTTASGLAEEFGVRASFVAQDALWSLVQIGHFDPEAITFLAVVMRLLRPAEFGVTVH